VGTVAARPVATNTRQQDPSVPRPHVPGAHEGSIMARYD